MTTREFCYWLRGFADANGNFYGEKLDLVMKNLDETLQVPREKQVTFPFIQNDDYKIEF